MQQELNALKQNHTWVLTQLLKGKKSIGSKLVYKIKYKPSGEVDRFKARLVAKGYNQIERVVYKYRFSTVAKIGTARIFIAIATMKSWVICQMDINNAFLHGSLNEEVFMQPPQGYTKPLLGQVCLLKRSLYGLK